MGITSGELLGAAIEEADDLDYEEQEEDEQYTEGNELIDSIQHTNDNLEASGEHQPPSLED